MKYHLQTEINIETTPEELWEKLMDFDSYPNWNPFIKSIQGDKELDGRLEAKLEQVNGQGMNIKPRITNYEPNKLFSWLGKLLFNGLFDAEHYFEIQKLSDQEVKFIHKEKFNGVLVRFFRKMIDGATRDSFIAMNEALKLELEN
ncbi:MAG: SRPBCC family protein [Candidatus Kariarchaeaceae archaeon]|jgi:hypothetical protein